MTDAAALISAAFFMLISFLKLAFPCEYGLIRTELSEVMGTESRVFAEALGRSLSYEEPFAEIIEAVSKLADGESEKIKSA